MSRRHALEYTHSNSDEDLPIGDGFVECPGLDGDNKEVANPPLAMWAQRNNLVYFTICLEDCRDPQITILEHSVHFRGSGGPEQRTYELHVDLFKEVVPEKCLKTLRGRNIEMILIKKEVGPFWPRLLSFPARYHWLKVDFEKWRDEDDSDQEGGGSDDLEEMMRQMGGLGGAQGGQRPNFNDLDAESDSDDEGLPDLE